MACTLHDMDIVNLIIASFNVTAAAVIFICVWLGKRFYKAHADRLERISQANQADTALWMKLAEAHGLSWPGNETAE